MAVEPPVTAAALVVMAVGTVALLVAQFWLLRRR